MAQLSRTLGCLCFLFILASALYVELPMDKNNPVQKESK